MTERNSRNPDLPGNVTTGARLPETPHDLPYDRAKVDALLERVRQGEKIRLIDELLACVDWRSAFATDDGQPIDIEHISKLIAYYREKFDDIGPVYMAELLSTEFMTEQRARGTIVFSDKLLELGRNDPELWKEIRLFFRRKEFATAMLVNAHEDVSDEEMDRRQTEWNPEG
ncbi:MAG TPA: hypothetical protein VNZ55_11600 [Thermomicrobiales bacterium]|nr:hypothetical protein [Thermomicrobiales bacterium]